MFPAMYTHQFNERLIISVQHRIKWLTFLMHLVNTQGPNLKTINKIVPEILR